MPNRIEEKKQSKHGGKAANGLGNSTPVDLPSEPLTKREEKKNWKMSHNADDKTTEKTKDHNESGS